MSNIIVDLLNEAFRGTVRFETTLAKMQESEHTLIESCLKMHLQREIYSNDMKEVVVECTGEVSFIRYKGEVIGELKFVWPREPFYEGSVTLTKY